MNEIEQVFDVFLGIDPRWLGLILMLGLILALCWRKKEASFIFVPLSILIGLDYLESVSFSDPLFYGSIIMMGVPIFIMVDYLRGNK